MNTEITSTTEFQEAANRIAEQVETMTYDLITEAVSDLVSKRVGGVPTDHGFTDEMEGLCYEMEQLVNQS